MNKLTLPKSNKENPIPPNVNTHIFNQSGTTSTVKVAGMGDFEVPSGQALHFKRKRTGRGFDVDIR